MNVSALRDGLTYPHGFLDFLTVAPRGGHRIGDYAMQEAGLGCFNRALGALSPESPAPTLDQMATAAQRALDRYPDGKQPAFVTSRLATLARLESLVADAGWNAEDNVRAQLQVLREYIADPKALIPSELPVVGRLDDAVLIDVVAQLLREDFAEYEDFCRFRQVAADFANMAIEDTGLTRAAWIEALTQSRGSRSTYGRKRVHYVPDPRSTLFHVT